MMAHDPTGDSAGLRVAMADEVTSSRTHRCTFYDALGTCDSTGTQQCNGGNDCCEF